MSKKWIVDERFKVVSVRWDSPSREGYAFYKWVENREDGSTLAHLRKADVHDDMHSAYIAALANLKEREEELLFTLASMEEKGEGK